MKTLATISTVFLFLFLAVSVPAFSQEPSDRPQTKDEKAKNDNRMKSQDENRAPKNDDKAMKQDDRGMKQDEGKRDEARPDSGKVAPAHSGKSQPEQVARPDQRQEDQRRDDHAYRDRQQRPVSAGRGQRIPDDKFREHFGREHHFHVDRARIVNQSQPIIVYGGYSFELVDAWPADWSYDDDCYIDYVDDGYYLFDLVHPGIRIAVIVLD